MHNRRLRLPLFVFCRLPLCGNLGPRLACGAIAAYAAGITRNCRMWSV